MPECSEGSAVSCVELGSLTGNPIAFSCRSRSRANGCVGAVSDQPEMVLDGLRICGTLDFDGSDARVLHRFDYLRNQLGAEPRKLLIGDRCRLLEPIKLFDFVGNAEADRTAQLFPRLLRLLTVSLRHAPRLGDQVSEYAQVGKHNQTYHPYRLDPTGYVTTPEQVAKDCDEQPKP